MQPAKVPQLNTSIPIWVMVLFVVAVIARITIKVVDTASPVSKSHIAWRKPEFVKKYDKSAPKLLFFDFTAEWCGPCKSMDKTTFLNQRVTELLARDFEAVRVVDREAEEGKNPPLVDELQNDYSVYGFPTVVVALPDLTKVASSSRYNHPREMAKFLQNALDSAGFIRAMVAMTKEDYKEAEKYLDPVKDVDWESYSARRSALVYWHVYRSLGKEDKARDAVAHADRGASKRKGDKPKEMPHPLYKYMRGELSAEDLLKKCKTKYDESDAHCAFALNDLHAGNRQKAIKEFVNVLRLGESYYSGSNVLAKKFLNHLEPAEKHDSDSDKEDFQQYDYAF